MRRKGRAHRHHLAAGRDKGATIVEYVLLVSLLAVLLAVSLTMLGADLSGFFSEVTGLWP